MEYEEVASYDAFIMEQKQSKEIQLIQQKSLNKSMAENCLDTYNSDIAFHSSILLINQLSCNDRFPHGDYGWTGCRLEVQGYFDYSQGIVFANYIACVIAQFDWFGQAENGNKN